MLKSGGVSLYLSIKTYDNAVEKLLNAINWFLDVNRLLQKPNNQEI